MYILRTLIKFFKPISTLTVIKRQRSDQNVIKSKAPDIRIPNLSIPDYMWQNLNKWPDKTAAVCFQTGRSYSFGEIYSKSRNLAGILLEKFQLKTGDSVAVILPNVVDFPVVFLGAIQAGLVVTTVNPYYTADEMATQLDDSNSKIIFTVKEISTVVSTASRGKIPIILAEMQPVDLLPRNCTRLSELCDISNKRPLQELNPDDIAVLPYSSGTTGLSKGVQLTHRNVVANLCQMSAPEFIVNLETQGNFQDVVPVFLPLFHIYGMVGIFLNFLSQGCKLVMVPNFVATQFLKLLQLYQPTLLFAVPAIIVIILNNPKIKYADLELIRTVFSAAAPLGISTLEKFHDKTENKIDLIQMYGMTETSPLTLMQTRQLPRGIKSGGSGFLIPNTKAKIIPLSGEDTKYGLKKFESGELVVKGPQNMKGYHNNPDAIKDALLDNNWLRTGDVCYYDEDEHFFITERMKELIKVKGFQVAPAELEEILKSHRDIEDAAVTGIPHPVQGEAPKAFVVLKNNANVKIEQIRDFVASKVAGYKRLVGGVVVVEKIPRNVAGKILRTKLRDL